MARSPVPLMAEHIATTQHQFERKIRDRLFALAGQGAAGAVPGHAQPPALRRAGPAPVGRPPEEESSAS